jgi:hypothetical protein
MMGPLTVNPTAAWVVVVAHLMAGAIAPASAQDAAAPAAASSQACVAIVMPSATGVDGDATAFSTSLRDLLASYLTGPSLRAISLDARLPSQAIEEARQKQCAYVLLTTITRKRDDGTGWGRALGQAAGSAAYYGIPYGGGAAAAAARGAAVAGAHAVSTMASTTRAKDEVTLSYRVGTVDAVMRTAPKAEKAKARSDGEDLLTPLVEKAAESVAAVVTRK